MAISVLYWAVGAAKPLVVKYVSPWDEMLFISTALSLIKGDWLGSYDGAILVKGPGYPFFLAINSLLGLPVGLGQALVYLVAVLYFAFVAMTILKSRIIFITLVCVFLLLPVMYDWGMQRLLRDNFYVSITLLYFASLFSLFFVRRPGRSWVAMSLLLGVIGAFLLVTREENLWILPATILALVLAGIGHASVASVASRTAFAAAVAIALCSTVAAVNWFYYGRFLITETRDSVFSGALTVLYRAAAPFAKPYTPVPRAARLRIYEASPTFARLKPFFDPEGKGSPWVADYGPSHPNVPGDIPGGSFIWALRDGASRLGSHSDALTAAQFYKAITEEVDSACAKRLLDCADWLWPLVPSMSADQLLSVPRRTWQALRMVAMSGEDFAPRPSEIMWERRDEVLDLLNHPVRIDDPYPASFLIHGWYRGKEWISASSTGTREPVRLTRLPSPGLASFFSDPSMDNNLFILGGTCRDKFACRIKIIGGTGGTFLIEPSKAEAGHFGIGSSGAIHIDLVNVFDLRGPTLRTRLYDHWLDLVRLAQPVTTIMVLLGMLAFVAAAMIALIYLRMFPTALVLAAILFAGVGTRALLLAVIDASSFPALSLTYVAPAVPLAVAASVFSIYSLALLPSYCRKKVKACYGAIDL